MKVLKPNKNKLTQGYSSKHRGYDHSGKGDQNYYASFHGTVVQSKNSETKNWTNNGTLTTADYGNYIKIKAEVDGQVVYQLGAHFKQGTVLPKGTEVRQGQVIAQIGNTGNSTGAHSHTEYRDSSNTNFAVEFVDEVEEETDNMVDKKQIIIDTYKGTTGEYPNDDEINARLQENKNTVELIEDRLNGDSRAKERWLAAWEIETESVDHKETIDNYKTAFSRLRELLSKEGVRPGDDIATALGAVSGLVDEIVQLRQEKTPETIYRYEDKDYLKMFSIGNVTLIREKI